MSKMKKIFAVLLCVAMLMPLLPQPEAKEVEAAAGEVEIKDEKNNLFDMSKMSFPSPYAKDYLELESVEDSERGSVTVIKGKKQYEVSLKDEQFNYWGDVAWEKDVTYHISYYYKVVKASEGTFRFYAQARLDDADDPNLNWRNYSTGTEDDKQAFDGTNHNPNTTEWTKQEIIWTPASEVKEGGNRKFAFGITLFEGDMIYLDDIVIEKAKPDFTGAQVILSDGIQMKLYINDVSDVTNGLSAKVKGKDVSIQKEAEKKQYILIPLVAKEMTDNICAELLVNGETVAEKDYSVRDYARAILNDNTQSKVWNVVKTMLNYGAWAQTYFDYKKSDLANSIVPDTDKYSTDKQDVFLKKIIGAGSKKQCSWSTFSFPDSSAGNVMSKKVGNDENYGEMITITGTQAPTTSYYLWSDFNWEASSDYKISYWIKTTMSSRNEGYGVYPCPRYHVTDGNIAWRSYKDGSDADRQAFASTYITETTGWKYVEINWKTTENINADQPLKMAFNFKLVAGDSVSIAGLTIEKVGGVDDYKANISGSMDSFLGYTMALEDTTSVRLYFNAEPTNAKIDNNGAVIRAKGNRYYIEIPDVKAGELANSHTIEVTSGEQTMKITNFSVLSAATAAIQNDDTKDELKNLCIALVLYAEDAKAL